MLFPSFAVHYPREIALGTFAAAIPAAIRRRLLARAWTRPWSLYQLMAWCPGSLDLADGTPALALALASPSLFRPAGPVPLDTVRRLVSGRQRDILAWLGFEGTPSEVRILRKLDPAHLVPGRIRRLREVLGTPAGLLLCRHLPRLTVELVEIMAEEPGYLTTGLLLELAGCGAGERRRRLGELRVLAAVRRAYVVSPKPLADIAALVRAFDEVKPQVQVLELRRRYPPEFPAPPFPGIRNRLVPVRNLGELALEGAQQHNCVLDYAPRVYEGACCIYRMLHPVRATLSIVRLDGSWELENVACACNAAIPSEHEHEVVDLVVSMLEGTAPDTDDTPVPALWERVCDR